MKREVGKRGLSEVITTIIIIGISIIAIGIVWAVISSIISGSSNQVNIDKLTVKLDVTSAVMTQNGLEVSVKRDPGTGNISNLALVVSDGLRKETFLLNQTLEELQEKKFTLNYVGIVTNVEIVPFFSGQSGTIISGDIADTLKFGPSQTIKNIPGLVSWYRFEGNANDEMGMNDGVVVGNLKQAEGKYGKTYNFTSALNYVDITDDASLILENSNFTIVAWTYMNAPVSTMPRHILSKGNVIEYFTGYGLYYSVSLGLMYAYFGTGAGASSPITGPLQITTWIHMSTTHEYYSGGTTTRKSYLNGVLNKTLISASQVASSSGYNFLIGKASDSDSYPAKSVIDEVMIFNRTLSDSEIAALYALDLS